MSKVSFLRSEEWHGKAKDRLEKCFTTMAALDWILGACVSPKIKRKEENI